MYAKHTRSPVAYTCKAAMEMVTQVDPKVRDIEVTALEAAATELQATQGTERKARARLDAKYPLILPSEVLGWRNADGTPALAPFRLGAPEVVFAYKGVVGPYFASLETLTDTANLPGVYDDLLPVMRKAAMRRNRTGRNSWMDVELKCAFTGVIPREARSAIKAAMADFSDIRILAETPRWSPLAVVDPDPIAIGWDGEHWRVIAHFDLTPLEKRALPTGETLKGASVDSILTNMGL